MRKKVLAIALVFIMLFSLFTLTGCFGKDYSSDIAALQKEINKLKEEDSSNADYIKDLQDQLNNITQAITTSYDYIPDQEITVRFNGIDYYRFKLTREIHNSYNPDDICMTSHIHFCGYLTFTNLYYHEIKIYDIQKLFDIKQADSAGVNGLRFRYDAQQKEEKIKKNTTKTMPFNINYSGTNFMKKTIFSMKAYAIVNDNINANEYTIPLAVIPNFYTMTGDLESIPSL